MGPCDYSMQGDRPCTVDVKCVLKLPPFERTLRGETSWLGLGVLLSW